MESTTEGRDYNAISPSAKYVLLLKGLTDIPYARETAEIIASPDKYQPDFNKKDFAYWARVLHFDLRYKSIDQLLSDLDIPNILELSSGFSFRGLAATLAKKISYIDTDLPQLIQTKKEIMAAFPDPGMHPIGTLQILPLNALDEQQFTDVVHFFPPGQLAIVNEGLLMYLDLEEKRRLCRNVRDALKQRGGYWVTADIYVKINDRLPRPNTNGNMEDFFEKMNIRKNMFERFDAAETFFKSEGFVIDKEAEPEYSKSSALKYMQASATPEQLSYLNRSGKIHATWRLRLAEH